MSGLTYQVVRREKERRAASKWPIACFSGSIKLSNLMHKTGSRSLAKFRSTTQQWAVLSALSRFTAVRKHGMTVKELIEFLLTSRPKIITAVLNRLERLGFH